MSPVGFEPTISAGERPQTYALDRAATGTGFLKLCSADISWEVRGFQMIVVLWDGHHGCYIVTALYLCGIASL